jgi:predicted DCC family thiol-disulfide oxidoreductase YuxK
VKYQALVFFDSNCSLCTRAVYFVLSRDQKKVLQFAPLQGPTADHHLKGPLASLKNSNTLVLLEKKKVKVRSSAILRMLWLIGGIYRIAILFYPLLFLLNIIYRVIATNRRVFFSKKKLKNLSKFKGQLLP